MDKWIDLSGYSTKYGVSQSTLRRRIRSNKIQHKLERGKYYVMDSSESMETAPLFSRGNSIITQTAPPSTIAELEFFKNEATKLKKENQKLNAQIAELETLVKVLENNF